MIEITNTLPEPVLDYEWTHYAPHTQPVCAVPRPDHMKGASGNSIDHATASQYLRGMVDAGLHKLNYTYFIVDEPCFVGRDADGTLIENKTTWPNGLKAFAAELDQYGMKLGICSFHPIALA